MSKAIHLLLPLPDGDVDLELAYLLKGHHKGTVLLSEGAQTVPEGQSRQGRLVLSPEP